MNGYAAAVRPPRKHKRGIYMFEKSSWIWADGKSFPNDRVNFFVSCMLDEVPEQAEFCISCETKYWLFVNGELAVYDGGLFRESLPGCGYFDRVNLVPYLQKGKNEIAVHVWYFGNGGRNNTCCGKPGLIFSCEKLGVYSGADTCCERDPAYFTTQTQNPSYLYGGHNVGYDARNRAFALCPLKGELVHATVVGKYGDAPWNQLYERPIPLFRFSERIPLEYTEKEGTYVAKLSHAMQFAPWFRVCATGSEVIDVRSDRYVVNGGPGDLNHYFGHRAEYICRGGVQEFEMLDWIFGEAVEMRVPKGVKVLAFGVRESSYDCDVIGRFECDDERVNKLFEKSVQTLRVCMRENYMDCPDRERGQWIGDVSVQAPQIAYLLDKNALKLLRKAIFDFIQLRKGDRLVGNVPGDNFCELPGQSLNAISEWGMIASYYAATGDRSVLEVALEPSINYLKLWQTDGDGMLLSRKGDWAWFDHLYNIDIPVLEHCWYYSALKFVRFMAVTLKKEEYLPFLDERIAAIEKHFDERFWKESCYSGMGFADDRANAMAVLSGLCPEERYEKIRYLLMSVFNSSTYMENYVLIALCEMGYKEEAFRRMMCRYQPLIDSENSTLWEDFFHLGTRNHAWTGAPASILFRYFAGIGSDLVRRPVSFAPLKFIRCTYRSKKGEVHCFQESQE